MIYDHIRNIGLYKGLSPALDLALDYIAGVTADAENGTTQLVHGVKAVVSAYETRPVNEKGYEAHRQYIDVQSFIDYQLVMEASHNIDGYRLSAKFYKRRDSVDPRFKMVVWDSDLAFGNCNIREGWRDDTWVYLSNDVMHKEGENYLMPFWWQRLNEDPEYTAALKVRWAEFRGSTLREDRLMATIDSLAHVLTVCGAEQRNSQAWPRWGVQVWPNKYVATDHADEVNHIKQWLVRRLEWMDQQLDYHIIKQ